MRLARALLFVTLTAVPAFADEAKPADSKPEVTKKRVPFRVVKVMPESGQVLMFDKNAGTYVMAEVGQALDGYVVDAIDDDEVTLVAENGSQVILAAPEPPKAAPAPKTPAPKTPAAKPPAAKPPVAKAPAEEEPVDPYADAADPSVPVDPYAEPEVPKAPGQGGVRVASAKEPTATTDDDPAIAAFAEAVAAPPVRSVKAPGAKADAKKDAKAKPAAKASDGAALAGAATGTPAPAPAAPAGAIVIARSELDGALGDFGKLSHSFRATFTPEGVRFDAVNDGTLLTKIGLKKGDVITSVDNRPLRSIDDAANLYARAGSVRNTTIQVTRDGKPLALRVTIQ